MGLSLLVGLSASFIAQQSFADTGSTYHSVSAAVPASARRILVERFRGPPNVAGTLRARVVRLLEQEDDVDVVSVKALDAAETVLVDAPQAYAALLKELSLAGLVRGKLSRIGPKYRLRLSLVSSEGLGQGDLIYDATSLEGLLAALDKSVVFDLLLQLPHDDARRPGRTKPEATAAEPEQSDDSAKASDDAPSAKSKRAEGNLPGPCPLFALAAHGAWIRRNLVYQGEEPGPLRGYRSTALPAMGGALELRPFSRGRGNCPGAAGLGLRASANYLLATRSSLADEELASRAWDAAVDLEYRTSAGVVWAGPFSGFRARAFAIERDLVVDTALRAWRAGLAVGLHARGIRLELRGAFELVLAAPELASEAWFPHAKGLGIDAGGTLSWAIMPPLELFTGGAFVGYRFDLRPEQPGSYVHGVAQRALDSYVSAVVGARWVLRPQL